jgi:hypothetical protein
LRRYPLVSEFIRNDFFQLWFLKSPARTGQSAICIRATRGCFATRKGASAGRSTISTTVSASRAKGWTKSAPVTISVIVGRTARRRSSALRGCAPARRGSRGTAPGA